VLGPVAMQAHPALLLAVPALFALAACAAPGSSASPPITAERATTSRPAPVAADLDALRSHRVSVRHAEAGEVAAMLRHVLDVSRSRDVRAILEVPGSSEIVVVGTDAGVARVVRMLTPDVAATPEERGVEVLALQHADARKMASAMEQVAPHDTDLVADEPTNSIVIQGPPASRRRVVELARQLDRPGS
jgi:hypothetical protein